MNTIKRSITALLIVAAFFSTTSVQAQSFQKGQLRFGIGVDALLPVGKLSNVANFGAGVTPRLQYAIGDNFALTFTSGIYHFYTKDIYINDGMLGSGYKMQNDLDIIPVKVGVRSFLNNNLYIAGEIGAGFEVDNGGGDTKFVAAPSIGYASRKWDVGLRYEKFRGQGFNYGLFGLRVAYGFGM